MATELIDALDDPIVPDGNTDFTGGQYSSSGSMPATCYAEGKNIDFDPFGRPVTRRGAKTTIGNIESGLWETADGILWETADGMVWGTSLSSAYAVDALFFFSTYSAQYLVAAQNGAIYQGTEGAVYSAIASATYSGALVYFAQLNNRLYYCDGTNALKYIDSSLAYSAITAGKVSSLTVIEPGVGYVAVPAVTFSSGAAAATAILGYGGKVLGFTVTTPSSGYSATTPPSATLAAAPAGGTTATCRVNITQIPSKPKFLTVHKNRLFCCSNDTAIPPDTIYASDILDGESWDLVGSSIRVGGDGDPITGIYSWFDNNLLVFKQRSVWIVNTDPLASVTDWPIKIINNRIGCVSHRTVQAVGSDVFFLSRSGIRSVAQIESGAQSSIGLPLSQPVNDIIQDMDLTYSDYFCSASYGSKYMVAVVTSGNTRPNKVVVYDAIRRSFPGYWTGWTPRDFTITAFSGKIRLTFADGSGRVWTWDDYTAQASETGSEYKDDTTEYESYVITRPYAHNEPLVKKLGHMVQLITENSLVSEDVTAYFSYDQDQSGTFTSLSSSITLTGSDDDIHKAWNLISKGKYRSVQFKFGTASKKVIITALAVTANVDALIPEIS